MNLKEIISNLERLERELAHNRFYTAAQHVRNAINDLAVGKTGININGNSGQVNVTKGNSTINNSQTYIPGTTVKWEEF